MPAYTYLHNIDPYALELWSGFGIRWYGLAYLFGFVSGYWIVVWLSQRGKIAIPRALISDFVFTAALGCIFGGRLGYCAFYKPELLISFYSEFPFWGVFAINEGGMASHGGIIGMVLASIWFARRHRLPVLHLFDLTILGSTLGIFCGRIANFINGELVGRACQGSCLVGVQFPQDVLSWPQYFPEKLSTLSKAAAAVGTPPTQWDQMIENRRRYWNQIYDVLNKLVTEVQAGNSEVAAVMREVLLVRHPSQLYAALLEGLFIFLILFFVWRKPRRPGVITAGFFSLYAAGRILGEQFRLPDLHLSYQLFHLTRGQWLSLPLLLIGLALLWYWSRRDVEPLCGWQKQRTPQR